jgi:hypothetical protein
MGAVKQMLIEQAELLEEKLNSVIPYDMSEYGFDECQELIMGDIPYDNKVLATHLWKVAQLSPEDGNRLMDISEDLYIFAMEEHKE